MSTNNGHPPMSPLLKVITVLLVIGALVLGLKSCADMKEQQREEAQMRMFFQQLNDAMKGE